MSDLSSLALFAFASLALASVPRPEMLLIAPHGATQGRAAGFDALARPQTGTYRQHLGLRAGACQDFKNE